MRELKSAQAQMDEAITNNDKVEIHVSHELIEVVTKKLETMLKHWEQNRRNRQCKVRIDIGKK